MTIQTIGQYELRNGERVEIAVFGYWIPGQVTSDMAGWHLLTPDQVEIPLHSGLTARHCGPGSSPTPPLHPVEMNAPHILLVDDDPALLRALPQAVFLRIPEAKVDTIDSAQGAGQSHLIERGDRIKSKNRKR